LKNEIQIFSGICFKPSRGFGEKRRNSSGQGSSKIGEIAEERDNLLDEYKNLVAKRGGINTNNAENFMGFINYAQRLKDLTAEKNAEIRKQEVQVEKARAELIKKTQDKKALEVLKDSQKAAFKLAEKRMEAKQTDEAATQKFLRERLYQ